MERARVVSESLLASAEQITRKLVEEHHDGDLLFLRQGVQVPVDHRRLPDRLKKTLADVGVSRVRLREPNALLVLRQMGRQPGGSEPVVIYRCESPLHAVHAVPPLFSYSVPSGTVVNGT